MALLWVIVGAAIYFTCDWGITKINPKEPFKYIATVVVVLITVVLVINGLLGLVNHSFITW